MEEPTSDPPGGPARTKLARALAASVRRRGEKGTLAGRIATAGLAVALTCALAVGAGAIVSHTKSTTQKSKEAAARHSLSTSPTPPGKTPLPSNRPNHVPLPGGPAVTRPNTKADNKSHGKHTKNSDTKKQSVASVTTKTIVNYASDRCIDVTNEGQTGIPIQIWDCNPVVDWKRWAFYPDHTIRSMQKCMTAAGGSANGTPIELAPCNGGASQRFVLNNSLDLVNTAADKCVDVKDKKTANGTPLQLWQCNGTSNQKWHTG